MVNKVTLIGNLGKDPEVRHLESGASVARLTLATNESYKDKAGNWQNQTEWHNVVLWRILAERAERELKKGSLVYVEGKLRTRQYQDANGIERFTTEIEAQNYRLLEKKEKTDQSFPASHDEPAPLREKPHDDSAKVAPPADQDHGHSDDPF